MIKIEDAAIVSWPKGDRKSRTRHLNSMAGMGALDGAFWGLLLGMIFLVPLFGAAMDALSGSFTDVGIEDKFVKRI